MNISTFDVASNIAQSVADLAESEGGAVGRVMKDVSTNAETFAKFSMDGAQGLARAAVEAAKIGGELKTVLEAADSLLKFESSLTAQFKAHKSPHVVGHFSLGVVLVFSTDDHTHCA